MCELAEGSIGGVHFIWEVADSQSIVQCFSNDDDKQGGVIFPGKALHTSKRRPLHSLALFTEEAAKQEVPEEIRSSFREITHGVSMCGLLLRDDLGTSLPIFRNGCPK